MLRVPNQRLAAYSRSEVAWVGKIQACHKRKEDKPTARCAKCKSKWHTTDKCKKCNYCSQWGHSTQRCWDDPSNNHTRRRLPPTVNAMKPAPAQAPTPTTQANTVNAISSTLVARVGVDGPTPRIWAHLDNGNTIPILPDSGSCVNLKDENALDNWGLAYQPEDEGEYQIFDIQGKQIPIIGTIGIKFRVEDKTRQVEALVTTGSPLSELIVGRKTLSHLGNFKLSINAVTSSTTYTNPWLSGTS